MSATATTHQFVFGQVRVTVEAPEGFPLHVDLQVHPKDREQFEAAVAAFGGFEGFEPVKEDRHWLNVSLQGEGVTSDGTVFVPREVSQGTFVAYPGMAILAERQREAQS